MKMTRSAACLVLPLLVVVAPAWTGEARAPAAGPARIVGPRPVANAEPPAIPASDACSGDEQTVYPGRYEGTFGGAFDWTAPTASGQTTLTGTLVAEVSADPSGIGQRVTWSSGTFTATTSGTETAPGGFSFSMDGSVTGTLMPGYSNVTDDGRLTPEPDHNPSIDGVGSYTVYSPPTPVVVNWSVLSVLVPSGMVDDCVDLSGSFATVDVDGEPIWISPRGATSGSWTTEPTWELEKPGGWDQVERDIAAAEQAVDEIMVGAVDLPGREAAADALAELWMAHEGDPGCVRTIYLTRIAAALDDLKGFWLEDLHSLRGGPFSGPSGTEGQVLAAKATRYAAGWIFTDKRLQLVLPMECWPWATPMGDALLDLAAGFLQADDIGRALDFNVRAQYFDPSWNNLSQIQRRASVLAASAFHRLTAAYAADPSSVTFAMEAEAVTADELSVRCNNPSTGALAWLRSHGLYLRPPTPGSSGGGPGAAPVYHHVGATVTPDGTLSWDEVPGAIDYLVFASDPALVWSWTGTDRTVHVGAPQAGELPSFTPTTGVTYELFVVAIGADGRPSNSSAIHTHTPVGANAPHLRVTTNPPLPGEIEVDGVGRDRWGLNWVTLPVGAHQVCFGEVAGYAAPECQDVTLSLGATSTVEGVYAPNGYLRVVTSPAVASTIAVDGVPRNDWGLWTEMPPGDHQVCFGKVAGFVAPACRQVTVVAGSTLVTTGAFTADAAAPGPAGPFGYLRATTAPPANAMISVDGQPRNNWGLDWVKLSVGSHEVCFGPATDMIAPGSCTTVDISAGTTSSVTGTYGQMGFLRVVTSPSVPATVRIDREIANAWGVWTAKVPGTYTVCFGPVSGRVTPACQQATVSAHTTATVTGTYEAAP